MSSVAIVDGIDPDVIHVRSGEADHLESHERDLVDERQVAGDELCDLDEVWCGLFVDHDTDLDGLLELREVEDAADRCVERAFGLNDVVVEGWF